MLKGPLCVALRGDEINRPAGGRRAATASMARGHYYPCEDLGLSGSLPAAPEQTVYFPKVQDCKRRVHRAGCCGCGRKQK
jgi:hypothetical protein